MKRLMVPLALVLVIGLGTYAIFAQQSSDMMQGGEGGMMGGGAMGSMSCSGCAMMQTALVATPDGGVVVATCGKLVKYDAALKKVAEATLDTNSDATSQTMQGCPMMKMTK